MIGRHIFSFRKLVYLIFIAAVALLIMNSLHILLPSEDKAMNKNDVQTRIDILPRIFAHSFLEDKQLSKDFIKHSSHPIDNNYSKPVIIKSIPAAVSLKTLGLEIISDPLDLRLQVHPNMLEKDAEDIFHRYISELHAECRHHVRLGNITDGGWDMCVAGPYIPANGSCLVYSFGIGDNWSFDDDISKRFGCIVRSFDPSINSTNHQRSPGILFYNIGIGSNNSVSSRGWKLMTFSDILQMCHDDSKIIDYLKIDIESFEWDVFEEILHSYGNVLANVKQLAFELHTKELDQVQSSKADLVRYWKILHGLEMIGFRRWYWHFNLWGFFPSRTLEKYLSCCYEIVYININYIN